MKIKSGKNLKDELKFKIKLNHDEAKWLFKLLNDTVYNIDRDSLEIMTNRTNLARGLFDAGVES